MRKILLTLLCVFFAAQLFAQSNCGAGLRLFTFKKGDDAVIVTKLGAGMEFSPLSGRSDTKAVFDKIKDTKAWANSKKELEELNALLVGIGFTGGVNSPDLTPAQITNTFIPYGSEGNLGGTRKAKGGREIVYDLSVLQVKGTKEDGIPAWKITSPNGCYFYILYKCGNAFFGKDNEKTVNITATAKPLDIKPDHEPKTIPFTIFGYKHVHVMVVQPGRDQNGQPIKTEGRVYDDPKGTYTENTITANVPKNSAYNVVFDAKTKSVKVYADTDIPVDGQLISTSTDGGAYDPGKKDTVKAPVDVYVDSISVCPGIKFELGLNGGFSFNTVPDIADRFTHTRAATAHFTSDISFAYLVNKNVQVGLDVAEMVVEYKDDAPYPRTSASSALYSGVFLGKPMIPIQLFGKVSWGDASLRTNISLSLGYAIATNGQITNSDVLLTTKPDNGGGLVAGLGLGADYFWNCNWGIGATVKCTYMSLSGPVQNYNLFVYPVTIGLRYRF